MAATRGKNVSIGLIGLAAWGLLIVFLLRFDLGSVITGGSVAEVALDAYEVGLAALAAIGVVLLVALRPPSRNRSRTDAASQAIPVFESAIQAFLARQPGPTGQRQLMASLVESMSRLSGAAGASLEVLEGDDLVYSFGVLAAPPNTGRQPLRSHPFLEVVRNNRIVRLPDPLSAAGGPTSSAPPYRSAVGLPVGYAGRVLAVVRLVSPEPEALDEAAAARARGILPLLSYALWKGAESAEDAGARVERDAALAKVKDLEARLATLADQLDDVHWLTDAKRESLISVNGAYERVFQRSPDKLYTSARAWYEAVHPDDRDAALQAALQAKEGAFDATYRIVRPDKSVAWIREQGRLLRDGKGQPLAWSAIARDVTEHARLEAFERRVGFTLENSSLMAYAARPDGDYGITFISPNVTRVLGYSPGEILRDSNFWSARLHPEDQPRVFADFPTLFKKGTLVHEYRFKHSDGTWRTIRDEMALLRTEDGKPYEIVGYWTDVTEAKRNEEGVSYSLNRIKELQDSRTRILNAISHDLANPITPMRLQLHMMKDKLEKGSAAAKSLEVVARNLDQLTRLIEDLKDLARLEAGKLQVDPQPTDLTELARSAVESFQATSEVKGIHLKFEPGGPLPLEADPQRIGQVLYNFLSNAQKFTPEKGTIRVETRRDAQGATVRVTDTGRGLTRDEMDRLFKPFSQVHDRKEVKEKGTGLGLYICKGLIESHHGRIFVESPGHGRGSTFGFTLPTSGKDVPAAKEATAR